MTMLKDYQQFDGRHWETGSVRNALAYQGVKAPHTGGPLSEALLLGVSGGINFGYFIFHYEGYDPQLSLLTRNTFDPLQTLLERLGINQNVLQTASAEKGHANLMDVLESGRPAIVWADVMSLPYNAYQPDEQYWDMQPVVVFGHDGQQAHIADRSSRPLIVDAETFAKARARIKKDKFRVLSLDPPDFDKLPAAVANGVWQCIRIFTEAPPRGTPRNFGLRGLQHWAEMLANTRNKQSWARYFPPGSGMYNALAGGGAIPGVYGWIQQYSGGDGAERASYAAFLEEAATILDKPALKSAADLLRRSHAEWVRLAGISLPEEIPAFAEARELLDRRYHLFIEQGGTALVGIQAANARLRELKAAAAKSFPLNEQQVAELREAMSAQILKIHDIEKEAVQGMQDAMA
jgi:hypothetical protein